MKKNNRSRSVKTYNTGRQGERRTPVTSLYSNRDEVRMRVGNMDRPVHGSRRPRRQRGRKRGLRVLLLTAIILFLLPLYVFGVYSLCDQDATVSEVEKRTLKTRPAFSVSALFNGSYTKEFEEYYADTFPLRDFFLSVNNFFDSFLTKLSGSDGIVLVGKDGDDNFAGEALTDEPQTQHTTESGTEPQTEPSTEATTQAGQQVTTSGYIVIQGDRAMEMYAANKKQITGYADAINRLADKLPNTKVYCMLVPTSIEFYGPEEYHSANHSQEYGIQLAYDQMSDKVTCVDAYSKIKAHINDYLYFRTDHHWTARGAYYGYQALGEVAGFSTKPLDSYKNGKIDGFVGTMYGYTNADVLKQNPDYVEYFWPQTEASGQYYSSAAMTDGRDLRIITTEVSNSNKYLAFIQGDNPLVKISTQNKNGRSILVIKESYGNALVPFLVDSYENVYVVDPRKIDMNLAEFVSTNAIQEVLAINYSLIPGNSTYMDALNKLIGS